MPEAPSVPTPMQFFIGVNKLSPPGDKLTFGKRNYQSTSRVDYGKWLKQVQDKCNYCSKFLTPIAFILDDVYFGFRTPELFSYKYF